MADEHDEAIARLQAQVDQLVSASGEVSRTVGAYFNNLLLQGLERSECLELALDWQRHLLDNARAPDADDE